MNKRFLGLLVAVLAFVGGLFAIYNIALAPKNNATQINQQGAAGFAASFLSAYFTYSNETMFEPINQYINLIDIRKASDNLIQQEVISAETIDVQQLQDNYIKANVLLNLKSKVIKKGQYSERLTSVRNTYLASVRLLEEAEGFRVLQYPTLQPYMLNEQIEPPFPKKMGEDSLLAMRPMVLSFCRTFFVSDKPNDISNYFVAGASIPEPLKNKFELISLEKLKGYGENKPWLIYAIVRTKDISTEMEFNMSLEMFITYKNDRFLIEDLIF